MASTNRPLGLPEWINWIEFADRDSLARALAEQVSEQLSQAIATHGEATLVVSGGSTPLPFFKALSKKDRPSTRNKSSRQATLPWEKVNVTLADERFVAADHQDSNERLVRENLLVAEAAVAKFIPLYHQGLTLAQSAVESSKVIRALPHPLDVLVLGMGNDGHTASLFPASPSLAEALSTECKAACLPMHPLNAPHERLTLTLPVLSTCRLILLHIVGEDKLTTLEKALSSDDNLIMPIRAFLKKPLSIYWSK